jgi:hypothetical protein
MLEWRLLHMMHIDVIGSLTGRFRGPCLSIVPIAEVQLTYPNGYNCAQMISHILIIRSYAQVMLACLRYDALRSLPGPGHLKAS